MEEVKISDEVKKELYDFFEHDESFVEIPNNQDTKQYINVRTITKILIEDVDDYINLKIYFVNDDNPLNKIMQEKDGALKIISEIKEKIEKLKSEYVDHF